MTYATFDKPHPPRGSHRGGETGAEATVTVDPRRWLALIVVLIAGFMDLLDVTIVNIAVPSIQRDLGAEYSELEWIIAGAEANAHNFARTFAIALWYGVGILVLVFAGLFALPRHVRARDLDAELTAAEPVGMA